MGREKVYRAELWGLVAIIAVLGFALRAAAQDTYLPWEGGPAFFAKFSLGPSSSPDYFTRAVWLQSPRNAA